VGLFVIFGLMTIFGVEEIQRPPPEERSLKEHASGFLLDPKVYSNFYWVTFTRALFDMGVYSFLPFIQYLFQGDYSSSYYLGLRLKFLLDILNSANPALMTSLFVAILIVTSIPSALIVGAFFLS
jgi:hypothetical protein